MSTLIACQFINIVSWWIIVQEGPSVPVVLTPSFTSRNFKKRQEQTNCFNFLCRMSRTSSLPQTSNRSTWSATGWRRYAERTRRLCTRLLCKYVTNSTGNSVFEMPVGIWTRGSVLTEYLIRAGHRGSR